jgi:chemotaxis protein MotB
MSEAEAIGRATGFGRLLARDASLLPAVIVAGTATAFTVISPPAWLTRLPQAVVDVATGERQELQQQLATASAQSEQATKQLAEASTVLTARDQTIATQQQELTNLKAQNDAGADKLAQQAKLTEQAVEAARQEGAANVDAARKALLASEQTVSQQAETIAALRQQAADSGAKLTSLEAEQNSQAGLLANLTAERDRLRREASAEQGRVTDLEANIESLHIERDQLTGSLSALRTRLTSAAGDLAATEQTLAEREQALAARNATLEAQRSQLAALAEDVKGREATIARMTAELQAARAQSQGETTAQLKAAEQAFAAREQAIAEQAKSLTAERQQLEAERTRLTGEVQALTGERDRLTSALTAAQTQLADASAAVATAQQTVADKDKALAARAGELETMRKDSTRLQQDLATAQTQVQAKEQDAARLTRQSDALGDEVLRLAAVLGSAEAALQEQVAVGAAQRTKLEALLAGTVNQLSRYRSEFFAKLGAALGNRSDVTVVGDRFVVQAEILFASGSAELGAEGRTQLAKVARTLLEVAPTIPASVPWVVRVDGHTDDVPIQSSRFASNWELSTARAISVVRFLIDQGVPAEHLAATGFGEYQPIAVGTDPDSRRRNRRIELKLTER